MKKFRKRMKTMQAITLISLVITIVVLIILSTVIIQLSLGENGLFNKAKYGAESYTNAQEYEKKSIEGYVNEMVVGNRDVSEEDLIRLIKEYSNPVGTVIAQMGNSAPTGYLKCDGTVYNIADYPELANYFGSQFKDEDNNPKVNYFGGDGTTTFAVPNLQGEFLRGTGNNSHSEQGNGAAVGVHQNGTRIPRFGAYRGNGNNWTIVMSLPKTSESNFYIDTTDSISSTTSYSTNQYHSVIDTREYNAYYTSRPTNTSVLYCIKYK